MIPFRSFPRLTFVKSALNSLVAVRSFKNYGTIFVMYSRIVSPSYPNEPLSVLVHFLSVHAHRRSVVLFSGNSRSLVEAAQQCLCATRDADIEVDLSPCGRLGPSGTVYRS